MALPDHLEVHPLRELRGAVCGEYAAQVRDVTAYYNENDPKAAAWLRALVAGGHIAHGEVDERSIADVEATDLAGFVQCHFFAGIGGWSYALRLAGWPDDRPVWTGSCPCQPFSVAGKGLGAADDRHLWPEFQRLIALGRPATIFGEQVASKPGRLWLAGVRADLETLEYAVGAADLCAAGAGAPHIRQRLYWVADADRAGCGAQPIDELHHAERDVESRGDSSRLAESDGQRSGILAETIPARQSEFGGDSRINGMADAGHERTGRAADAGQAQGRRAFGDVARRGAWSNFDILPCTDGKSRRVESGTFPLAHGIPARMGRLRGYGNAIVAPLAAQFIKASIEAIQ